MSATHHRPENLPEEVSLLELMTALGKLVDSPHEAAAHAREMIQTGAVRVRGNTRGVPQVLLGRAPGSAAH